MPLFGGLDYTARLTRGSHDVWEVRVYGLGAPVVIGRIARAGNAWRTVPDDCVTMDDAPPVIPGDTFRRRGDAAVALHQRRRWRLADAERSPAEPLARWDAWRETRRRAIMPLGEDEQEPQDGRETEDDDALAAAEIAWERVYR